MKNPIVKESDPVKRFNNLLTFLEEQKNDSPYTTEAWDEIDEQNRVLENENNRLKDELAVKNYQVQKLWDYVKRINKENPTGKPDEFFEFYQWFDGVEEEQHDPLGR